MNSSDPRLLANLPVEIIQNVVFKHVACKDIRSLTRVGNKRLYAVSKDYLERYCTEDCVCKRKFRTILFDFSCDGGS